MQAESIRNCRQRLVGNINGKGRTQYTEGSQNSGCDNKDYSHFIRHFMPLFTEQPAKRPDLVKKIWSQRLTYKMREILGYPILNVMSLLLHL